MNRTRIGLVLIFGFLASPAQAHYLFVAVTPPAEAGRAAEVYFSELAEAGDPQFIDKIVHTRLWLQAAPGKFQPLPVLKAADRLRSPLPGAGSLAVVGACEYGVLARKPSFLLRHFPKAIDGKPEELNRLQPTNLVPLEITAQIAKDEIKLLALRDGKPLPGAVFHTVAHDLTGDKLQAGPDGSVSWKPPAPGRYSIYTRVVTKKPGTWKGKNYDEIRDFATLAFTWPLNPEPDPAAVKLFQEALAARAIWKNFPGFTAQVKGTLDGRPFAGTVTVAADGTVEAQIKDEAGRDWLQEQLESIVLHRGAGNTARSSGKEMPRLRFADAQTDHPLGRLVIFEGGRFASSYRIKDRQIMVVNRHLGKSNMTITVLDNDKNAEGKFLPRSYTVHYWDTVSGNLLRSETFQDRWRRLGSWDLPASHTVCNASSTGLSVRSFILSNPQLLKK